MGFSGTIILIAMLDDEYSVAIENEDFMKLITVEDLMNEVIRNSKIYRD